MKIKQICLLALLTISACAPQQVNAITDYNAGVSDLVRFAFGDAPDMIKVAQCESGTRQFTSDGSLVRGGTKKNYVGIFQIDELIHRTSALNHGIDIYTASGNIAYARRLYDANGTAPWKGCLGSTPVIPKPTTGTSSGPITINMNIGMVNSQVLILQQTLNKLGFTVAASGPGSPGNETTMFGALTREAVKKFQCAKGIVCSGNESTTGFGRVGPTTRSFLAK